MTILQILGEFQPIPEMTLELFDMPRKKLKRLMIKKIIKIKRDLQTYVN